jgi:hypothetical protein
LKNSIDILEKQSSREVISFRPPETRYDEETIKALKNLHIKILSSDFIEDRSVPQYYDDMENILIIPKTGYDDYDIFHTLKIRTYVEQAERYLLDYRRTSEEGGLYNLYYHSQIQCLKDYVDALEICINQFKADKAWITTADKVYEWWSKREKLFITPRKLSDDQYIVEITNNNDSTVEDVVINFAKNNLNDNFGIRDNKNSIPYFSYNPEQKLVKIFTGTILSKETKTFLITADNS